MKNKSTLTLIEQSLMLLIFALAATLCLRAFMWSDKMAKDTSALDHAVTVAQNMAETLKARGSKLTEDIVIHYNKDWQEDESGEYRLVARDMPSGTGLAKAHIAVEGKDGIIFELTAAWQEVVR